MAGGFVEDHQSAWGEVSPDEGEELALARPWAPARGQRATVYHHVEPLGS